MYLLVVVDFRYVAEGEHLLRMLLFKVAVGGNAVVSTHLVLCLHRFCVLWGDRGESCAWAITPIHIHHHLRRCEQEASLAGISVPQVLLRKNRFRINVIAVLFSRIIPIIVIVISKQPSGAGAIGSFTVSDVHRWTSVDRIFGFDHGARVGW